MEKRLKSIAVSIAVFAVLFGLIAPVQAALYTVQGYVYGTDGVTGVDGAVVTVTDLDTGDLLSDTTEWGGFYAVAFGFPATADVTEGDILQIVATYETLSNTTTVAATGSPPQQVDLVLQEVVAPEVTSTSPADGDTDVIVATTINVQFSTAMNTTSVESAFSLSPTVSGLFVWNPAETIFQFSPSADLDYGTTYTATISTAAEDAEGNPLASEYTWSFTTEADTIPPVIHSVTLNPTVVSIGGSILVTVNATDNDEVSIVRASGGVETYITLTQSVTNPDIWTGTITAKSTPDTYTVAVRAYDPTGNYTDDSLQSYTVVEEWEFTIEFVAGYNMITLPVNDTSVTNASLLIDEIGAENCTEMYKWGKDTQTWVPYNPSMPPQAAFDIAGGEGYFLSMSGPATVTFTGMGWETPFTMSLVEGYNMIGIPVNDTSVTNASLLIDEIGAENCTEMYKWGKDTQTWVPYNPSMPPQAAFDIVGGEGYFLSMTNPAYVMFEGEAWSD